MVLMLVCSQQGQQEPSLKNQLAIKGLSKSGVKAVLIQTLVSAISSPPAQGNPTIAVVEWSRDLQAYNPNTQWKALNQMLLHVKNQRGLGTSKVQLYQKIT
jgi:hypothetical protein